jgi:hypothetical protein
MIDETNSIISKLEETSPAFNKLKNSNIFYYLSESKI